MNAPRPAGPPDTRFRAARDERELALANQIIADVHGAVDAARLRWHLDHGDGYPGWRREHTRVAVRGGRVIGAVCIRTETLRLGEARLRCGALGMIAVAPALRRRGLARQMVEHAIAYLREHQYPLALLGPEGGALAPLGFAPIAVENTVAIDPLRAPRPGGGAPRARECKPGDLDAILRMHEGMDAETACGVVRSAKHLAIRWPCWGPATVLLDGGGLPFAYFLPRAEADALRIEEAGATDPDRFPALLAACAAHARREGLPRVVFQAPPGHPLARHLATHPARLPQPPAAPPIAWLAAVHPAEAFEALVPEWEQRVRDAGLTDAHTECTLVVGRAAHRIRAHRGAVDVAPLPGRNKVGVGPAELAALISGARTGDAVLEGGLWATTAEARALFRALFPPRTPWIWPQDRF